MAEKAIRGVIVNINQEGKLVNVSFGTAMRRNLDCYHTIFSSRPCLMVRG
ncbi:MAG: hypothetical protein ACSLEM_06870 [Candidatus Malihini olakiniferum]